MFVVFAGATHYPGGGICDYQGTYETLLSAIEAIRTSDPCCDWAQVVEFRDGQKPRLVGRWDWLGSTGWERDVSREDWTRVKLEGRIE